MTENEAKATSGGDDASDGSFCYNLADLVRHRDHLTEILTRSAQSDTPLADELAQDEGWCDHCDPIHQALVQSFGAWIGLGNAQRARWEIEIERLPVGLPPLNEPLAFLNACRQIADNIDP